MTEQQQQPFSAIAVSAIAAEKVTHVPAELTAAQCALESGYLAHAPGNNAFGIKFVPTRHKKSQVLMTTEYIEGVARRVPQTFAAFDSIEACFEDYCFIVAHASPYAVAWKAYVKDMDVLALARGVAAKYATDPHYSQKVLALMADADFIAGLRLARGAA